MKYYFETIESETCANLKYFKDKFKGKDVELYEALPYKIPNIMWCKKYYLMGDSGNCGVECEGYKPKNGKSGCCKYLSRTFYEPSDKPMKFKF